MTDFFTQNALQKGEEGKAWLENIPHLIEEYEKKWLFKVQPSFTLSYNYVAPVIMEDGTRAVVKIGFPKDPEFQTEMKALEVFNGDGAAKLLKDDLVKCIVLLEEVTPGTSLSTLENDEEATRILTKVMRKLWKPLSSNHPFIPITERVKEIYEYQEKYKKHEGPLPKDLIDKAVQLFDELIATSEEAVLVHGDLHHDNVLKSTRDDWLAIDPKGVAAERAYETAAVIRNPFEKLRYISDLEPILKKRIAIFSEELKIDPQRITKWCFAQTVLSAVWNLETVKGTDHCIRVAGALEKLLLSKLPTFSKIADW